MDGADFGTGHLRHVRAQNQLSTNGDVTPIAQPREKSLPYLTFAVTDACPFRCIYCGHGGEVTISRKHILPVATFRSMVDLALAEGIRKFRLTGGEPFAHPEIRALIECVISRDQYLLINTNGLLVDQALTVGYAPPGLRNLHIAVSLDSPREAVFDRMSGTSGLHARVMRNISLLKQLGVLTRINMVVTTANLAEVQPMVDFCVNEGINLKLQEMTAVPSPYGTWERLHVALRGVEPMLQRQASAVYAHDYARSHGIPVKVFQIGGVFVTQKSLHEGSRYNRAALCGRCRYFPCHEGLYDIQVLPDGRLATCRWNAFGSGALTAFSQDLRRAMRLFLEAEHIGPHADLHAMEALCKGSSGLGIEPIFAEGSQTSRDSNAS